ncbi:MAG: right-handed parallel beta-helix repeat-containing protein [Chitinispirillaceae bacterium]|nr:right-handed parallel beta-helix repeat-containing protein [Chitinispirillaceae bacterium]
MTVWTCIGASGWYQWFSAFIVAAAGLLYAETYYVAPGGNDGDAGTFEKPFKSLSKGCTVASAEDTVYFRGGTYEQTAGITIRKSGASDTRRIYFLAYQKERPVFDFSGIRTQANGVTVSNSDWLYFKGLEFCNVPQLTGATPNCVLVDHSSHITFELCEFHHNGGTGLFFAYGDGGHRVLNCDSHDNYDPLSSQGDGQNADGFGVHYQTAATDTTIVSGCRGWWNSDDGIDCIHQNTAVIFENSWFWLNGYKPGLMERPLSGNGQGIKAGGYDLPPNRVPAVVPQNIVRNCVSFLNGDRGLNANYHPVACKWYNNTSFGNKGGNVFMQGIDYQGGESYTRVDKAILRNNLSYNGVVRNCEGAGIDASHNSWDITGLNISESDFLSVDTAGVFGPRKADGSLPDVKFLHLSAGSELIDKGEDVGLPFTGAAPDLGAFEYRDPTGSYPVPLPDALYPVNGKIGGRYGAVKVFDLSGRLLPSVAVDRTCRLQIKTFGPAATELPQLQMK